MREPAPIAATSGLRRRTTSASIGAMSDPRTAPYASANLSDIVEDIRDHEDTGDGTWHLVRRHFDVQAFGVNASRGDAGDVLIIEHHERDDAANGTEGHEELFAIISGHAVFTIDGNDLDAPAGTLVFVRDPALLRTARDCRRHRDPRRRSPSWGAVCRLAMGAGNRLTAAASGGCVRERDAPRRRGRLTRRPSIERLGRTCPSGRPTAQDAPPAAGVAAALAFPT
jgi:hypothetical protein